MLFRRSAVQKAHFCGTGTWTDFDALMHYRSTTRSEIDFVGPWLARVPFEMKYTDGAWRRETLEL
jgi:hypothetical protein